VYTTHHAKAINRKALRPIRSGAAAVAAQMLLHSSLSNIPVALQQVGESFRAEIQRKLQLNKIGDIFGAVASVATAATAGYTNIQALTSKALPVY